MPLVRGILALAALWAYRLARAIVAFLGLASWLGSAWALAILVLAVAFRLHWVLRAAAFLALLLLWHWPWWVALPLAMPRAVLMLPGLISTAVARRRHPRPVWPVWPAPAVSSALCAPTAAQISDPGA
jgi:hypothetical protein